MSKFFTPQQYAGKPGMAATDRGVRIFIKKQGIEGRRRATGKGMEYPLASMPAETQAYFLKQLDEKVSADANRALVHLEKQTEQHAVIDGLAHFNGLPDAKRAKAFARQDVLQQLAIHLQGASNKGAVEEAFVAAFNSGELSFRDETIEIIPSVSVATLRRWRKALQQGGVAALAGVTRRPPSNGIDNHPELVEFLVALITSKPHLANQAGQLKKLIKVKADEYGWWQPSISTIRRWVNKWLKDNSASYAYLTNPDAYNSKHRPLFGTMYNWLSGPNQVWEFDSTPHDAMLQVSGKLKRYSIIAAIDVYTRRPMVIVSPTSESEGICLLLRKCLINWGMLEPEGCARTDNGSDYVSKRVTGIFDMLGIDQSRTAPFSGWEKPFIERFFKTLSSQLTELLPAYIGHSVQDRQQIESAKAFAQRIGEKNKRQAEKEAVELAMTPDELTQVINDWIQFDYMHAVHSGFKGDLKGKTPFEVTVESGYKPKHIGNPHALDLLLNQVGEATVTRGYVKAGSVKYTAPELMESAWDKQRVRVFLDPTDVGRATLYPLGDFGTYVEAVNLELIGRDISPEDFRNARKAERKALADFRRNTKQLQEKFGIDTLWAEKLAQQAAENSSLSALPVSSGVTDNPTITGLTAATQKPDEGYTEAELTKIERQREALAERKAQTEKQLQKVTRDAHEQARWLVDESLERELREHEKQWLKKYRLDNPLMAKSLDRRHEKATRNRAG